MQPSHVRKRILEEHTRLREQLAKLEAEVEQAPAQLHIISETASALLADLLAHTELEDAVLAPALLQLDAWGQVRERALREHHAEQRARLFALLDAYTSCDDADGIGRITRAWIGEVRADMQHEERELLNPALLRDDSVAIDMECG